jgi:hypothetical protein
LSGKDRPNHPLKTENDLRAEGKSGSDTRLIRAGQDRIEFKHENFVRMLEILGEVQILL